jgi:hypothetical protein
LDEAVRAIVSKLAVRSVGVEDGVPVLLAAVRALGYDAEGMAPAVSTEARYGPTRRFEVFDEY